MAQHDYNIANASFPTVRTDINNVLSAINTCNSGASRPSGAVAGTIWLDTSGAATAHLLNFYDGGADILLATINTTANTVDWADSSVGGTIAHKTEGTNFTNSLLVGHSTTGTLSSAGENTGVGIGALDALTSGDKNTVLGYNAGTAITSSLYNTAIGSEALQSQTTGVGATIGYNVAVGRTALQNTTGMRNTGLGSGAGWNLTSADGCIIIGGVGADSNTADKQLHIHGNDGSTITRWITGDSSGNIVHAGTTHAAGGQLTTTGKALVMGF